MSEKKLIDISTPRCKANVKFASPFNICIGKKAEIKEEADSLLSHFLKEHSIKGNQHE